MKIWIVTFEHHNDDRNNFVEAYRRQEDATKRMAVAANEHTDEDEIHEAFDRGDFEECIDLFVAECDGGADHSFNITETELK